MSMTDTCKTPMADHIAEFWRLLETEHVRVLVDIRKDHEPGTSVRYHWDSASFPDDTAKAIAADHRAQLAKANDPTRDATSSDLDIEPIKGD